MGDFASFRDLEQMAEDARQGSAADLDIARAHGVSLYEGDDDGNVFEVTADGHRYAVALENDRLVRLREVLAS